MPPYLEAQKAAQVAYFGPGAQEMFTEVGKAVEAVVFGQKQATLALEEAAAAGQSILDRERKK